MSEDITAQAGASRRLEPGKLIPLSDAMVNIGFALAKHSQPLHGYAIMKEVEGWWWRRSNLGPGSLYRTLPKMIHNGMVLEVEPGTRAGQGVRDAKKRYYKLTDFGVEVLHAQIKRDEFLLEIARSQISRMSLAPREDESEEVDHEHIG